MTQVSHRDALQYLIASILRAEPGSPARLVVERLSKIGLKISKRDINSILYSERRLFRYWKDQHGVPYWRYFGPPPLPPKPDQSTNSLW